MSASTDFAMLDLAAVLALSQACAPGVSAETLTAVAYVESRFNPFAIGINRGPGPRRAPRTAPEAIRVARELLARGANLDLGLAQINSANLEWLGLPVETAFDPCRNLAAAGQVLRAGYRPASGTPSQWTLRVALSRYNTGHPARGFRNGYVGRVEAAAQTLGLTLAAHATPAASTSALPARPVRPARLDTVDPPRDWDVFARADRTSTLIFHSSERPGSHP